MNAVQFTAGMVAGLLDAIGYSMLRARNAIQRRFISGAFIDGFDLIADAAMMLRQWKRRS